MEAELQAILRPSLEVYRANSYGLKPGEKLNGTKATQTPEEIKEGIATCLLGNFTIAQNLGYNTLMYTDKLNHVYLTFLPDEPHNAALEAKLTPDEISNNRTLIALGGIAAAKLTGKSTDASFWNKEIIYNGLKNLHQSLEIQFPWQNVGELPETAYESFLTQAMLMIKNAEGRKKGEGLEIFNINLNQIIKEHM
jgi:hypothetical protein